MRVAQPRVAPLWRNLVLLVGFLLLVVAGVFTVLLPELEEEPAETGPSAAAVADTGESDSTQPSE